MMLVLKSGGKKRMLKKFFTVLLVAGLFFVSGCIGGGDFTTREVTPYRTVTPEGETINYLTGEHPEVVAIKALIKERDKLDSARDFKTTDGKESLHLYTHDYAEYLITGNYIGELVKYVKENQMLGEFVDIKRLFIRFNPTFTVADGTYTLTYRYTHLAKRAQEKYNKKLGALYGRNTYFLAIKEANLWNFDGGGASKSVLIP